MSVKIRLQPYRGDVLHEVHCDRHGVVAAYLDPGRAEDRALAHAIGLGEELGDTVDLRSTAA